MQVIKAFGTERFEHDRVQRTSAERLKVGVESSRVEARFGALVDVLGAVATALVLVLGVMSVADGRISPGDLVVVVSYTNKIYKPLKDIAKQASRAARSLARLERIAEILSSDMVLIDGTDGSKPDHPAVGTVRLDDSDLTSRPAHRRARAGIARFPMRFGFELAFVPRQPILADHWFHCVGHDYSLGATPMPSLSKSSTVAWCCSRFLGRSSVATSVPLRRS